MKEIRFWKLLVLINGAVPLALLAWDAAHHRLGANGVNYAIHTTGMLALIFLVLSLAITPLRRLTGWNPLVGFRRSLGLYAFFYACLHLGIYFVFDRALSLKSTAVEIFSRRYLQIGFTALLLMAPLAITSTDAMLRRLGARKWKRLHRLAYVAAILGVIHYYIEVKSDVRLPLAFIAVLSVLLLARFAWHYFDLLKASKAPKAPAPIAATPSPAATAPARRKFWSGELQLARIFDETPEVRTFRFVCPDDAPIPFDYRPGQYLNLQLQIDGKRVNRSYTIASSPTRGAYCELSVKREDMGLASRHLHHTLREGDRLKISAPAGKFVFTGKESDSVVLIAGGVGITPLMSITRYLTDRGWPGEIYFLISARAEQDIIFRDELALLQKRFSNLHVSISLSRVEPDSTWSGERGRVCEAWLKRVVPDLPRRRVYICGPDAMMQTTRELLLQVGVAESNILIEAFVSPGVSVHDGKVGVDETADAAAQEAANAAEGLIEPQTSASVATAKFSHSGKSAPIAGGMTLLEAAESIGLDFPFECRSGICGQCKVRLTSGSVAMDAEDALSPREKAAGWILACQAHAHSDLVVEA